MDYLNLVTGAATILFGLITIFIVYQARRKYYGGPWKDVVVWIMWGVAIALTRVIIRYIDIIITPQMSELPEWTFFILNFLSFLCFMKAGFAIKNMAGFYSSKKYKRSTEENKLKSRRRA